MITENIMAEVKKARYFAIFSDEVQDAASIEQITFMVRCVHKEDNNYIVKEYLFDIRNSIMK